MNNQDNNTTPPSTLRRRRSRVRKPDLINPPYPWATARRARVHTMQYLVANGIQSITGRVQCKKCAQKFDVEYDLQAKFREVALFIINYHQRMCQRAPAEWMHPTLLDCKWCNQHNCVKPILEKKKSINWLFLFLGQMLGCCNLSMLKYFCKHTDKHRTGAKDRVLYYTFLELLVQLDPHIML